MMRRDWLYLTFDSERLGTSNCGARLRSAYCTTAPESSRRAASVFLSLEVSTAGLASAFFGFLAMLFLSVGGRRLLDDQHVLAEFLDLVANLLAALVELGVG